MKQNTFEEVKRTFERAYATDPQSEETGKALQTLAHIIALSVVKKCLDPQSKRTDAPTVSNSGQSDIMRNLRYGLIADRKTLENLTGTASRAFEGTYSNEGMYETETADSDSAFGYNQIVKQTLSDGMDLEQTACLEILEQAQTHSGQGEGWLDTEYTVNRLAKKVYIRTEDSKAYKEVETAPMREVFRAVRDEVEKARAIENTGKYLYIESFDNTETADATYFRLGRNADLGGYVSSPFQGTDYSLYTADLETVLDYEKIISALNLTAPQKRVLDLRIKGYGLKAIATKEGVSDKAIKCRLQQIQVKYISLFGQPKNSTERK